MGVMIETVEIDTRQNCVISAVDKIAVFSASMEEDGIGMSTVPEQYS